MAASINMAKMMRVAPALLVLLATLSIVVVSSTQTTDHEIYNEIESTTITTVITEAAARRSSIECLCSPRSYVFRIPKFLSLPSGDHSCDAHNNNNTIHKSKEGISDSLCIDFPIGNNHTTTIETTSLSFFEFSTSLNSTIIHQLSSSFDDDDEMDYHLVEFPSASQNLDPALPLEEQSELEVPGGVMLLLTGRMGGLDDASGGSTGGSGMATRDVNVQSTIAWNYDGRECRVEPMGVGDSIGWLIVEEYKPAIPEFCPATAKTVAELEDEDEEDDDAHKIFYSKSSKAGKSHGGNTIGGGDGTGNGKSKSGKGSANNYSHKSGKSNANNNNSDKSGKVGGTTHSGKSKSGKSGSGHVSGGKSGKSDR